MSDTFSTLKGPGYEYQKGQGWAQRWPDPDKLEWRDLRCFVWERDGGRCVYCGNTAAPHEVDHFIPRSRGGADHHSNLLLSCRRCNRAKKDREFGEWAANWLFPELRRRGLH